MPVLEEVDFRFYENLYNNNNNITVFAACTKKQLKGFVLCSTGDVWVFSIYQPNYDPTAGDGLYCNKTLYTFAFWNALWETFSFWVVLGKLFKGLMCGVIMIPAPRDGDFHRHV